MKRSFVIVLLCLAVALSGAVASGGAEGLTGRAVSGIIVETAGGASLELSALIEAKNAVVLYVFSPLDPPSHEALAMMDGVCRGLSDRVAFVAAAGEPGDGSVDLADWSAGLELSLPVGLASDIAQRLPIEGYPAALILDNEGSVVFAQTGAFASEVQFREIVGHYAGEGGDASPLRAYTVLVRDQYGQPVPGAIVGFCDAACRNFTADAEGLIAFTGKPARYSLHVASVPEGYGFDRSYEGVCAPGEWTVVEVTRE